MKRILLSGSTVFTLLVLLLGGCSNATEEVNLDEAPDPIPAAAFTVETGVFATAPAGTQVEHFNNARTQFNDVTLAVTPFLLMAEASAKALASQSPTADGGEFNWNTSLTSNGRNWTFTLRADPDGDEVDWRMFVTASNLPGEQPYDNFELFSATTNPLQHTGTWQVYYPIGGQRQVVLSGSYVVRSESDKEITFAIPNTTTFHPGDQVRYTVKNNLRTLYWKESGTNKETTITWDATTKAGNIVSERYNGGVKACWDASYKNTTCTV